MDYKIDSQKLSFHPVQVANWINGFDSLIYVEMSPVGYCNHNCVFCGLDFDHTKHKIDINVMEKTISSMAEMGVKSIMFAGEGEPCLHPDMSRIIKHCTSCGIDTALTTNFSAGTPHDWEVYLENCKWIKISLNAGDRETYEKIHQKDDFEKVWRNIQEAMTIKKEKGYTCTVGTQILLLEDNLNHINDLIINSRDFGLDYCVIKPYSQHLSSITSKYKEINYDKYLDICLNLRDEYSNDNFKVIVRENTMKNKDKNIRERFSRCWSVPNFWAYVEANGDVYTCSCFLKDERFLVGNVNDSDFKDIWKSEKKKQNAEMMKSFDISKCRINCRMAYCNEYLERVKNPQAHDSFI